MSSPDGKVWLRIFACPYCGKENSEEINYCCSERHCRWLWVTEDGDMREDGEEPCS